MTKEEGMVKGEGEEINRMGKRRMGRMATSSCILKKIRVVYRERRKKNYLPHSLYFPDKPANPFSFTHYTGTPLLFTISTTVLWVK